MHKRPKGSLKRLLFEPKYSPERKDRSESAFVGRKTKDTFLGDPFFRTNHFGRKMTERARSTVRSVNSFDMNSGNKLAKTSTDWK